MVRLASHHVHSPATDALARYLDQRGYDRLGIHFITASLGKNGELATAVAEGLLHPNHEAAATELVVNRLPVIPYGDPAWDLNDDAWEDGPALPLGALLYPPDLDDVAGGPSEEDEDWYLRYVMSVA